MELLVFIVFVIVLKEGIIGGFELILVVVVFDMYKDLFYWVFD